MRILGGKKSPWVAALTKNDSFTLLKQIRHKLFSTDRKLQQNLFYGATYPLWAGYSVSYYLVKDFLKNRDNNNLKELVTFGSRSKEFRKFLRENIL